MRKLYTTLFTAALFCFSSAQLTQTNHAPAPGDTYEMIPLDTTGISPGAAGAGVVWNFSAVATSTDPSRTFTVAATTDPSYTTNANVSLGYSANNQSHLASSAGSLLFYGGNFQAATVDAKLTYTAPSVLAVYPMTMGTTSSSVTGGNITATSPLPTSGTFTGNSTVEADGTGTLVLSTGTFTNVMRVRTTQTVDFSLMSGTVKGTLVLQTFEYFGALKAPLFSIEIFKVSALGNDDQLTFVHRNKDAVGTTTTTTGLQNYNADAIRIYPQPANNSVVFGFLPKAASTIGVFDITGRKVNVVSVSASGAVLDVSSYPSGLYIYNVKDAANNSLHCGRFTVMH